MNFELRHVPEDYVHGIGRTGRAGREGEAVSLVCVDEHELLQRIERLLKARIRSEIIPGYEPDPNIKAEPIVQGRAGNRASRKNSGPRHGQQRPRGKGASGNRASRGRRASA